MKQLSLLFALIVLVTVRSATVEAGTKKKSLRSSPSVAPKAYKSNGDKAYQQFFKVRPTQIAGTQTSRPDGRTSP